MNVETVNQVTTKTPKRVIAKNVTSELQEILSATNATNNKTFDIDGVAYPLATIKRFFNSFKPHDQLVVTLASDLLRFNWKTGNAYIYCCAKTEEIKRLNK